MLTEDRLKNINLIKELDREEQSRLLRVLKERRCPKGSYIVYAEDPGPSVMFILEGKVKINLVSDEGKEVVLANLEAGEFFGEIALLTGEDRSANVVAVNDCVLLVLGQEDFRNHILQNSGLALALMRELALRLRTASTKIGDLALYDVYERVYRTLKSLAKEAAGGKMIIQDRPTHQELSAMVGTSREMVSRALKDLEEEGAIVIEGKRVELRRE